MRKYIIIATTIILALVLAGLLCYNHILDNNERQAKLEQDMKRVNDSFYQKLSDGFDVNVLIVGDSISEGTGASDIEHSWPLLLQKEIQNTYGVLVTLTNVSMGGNSSYAGYVRTMALDDDIDYDLVILCCGQNDSQTDFDLYYETMIRAAKTRYPKASLLSILESSQRYYTPKMKAIQALANHYGIPVVDTIVPFKSDYDSLVKDAIHPNDAGHAVYCDTTMSIINSLVADQHGLDPKNVDAIREQTTAFDNFQWLSADKFTREGNTFSLNISTVGKILGIDYNFISGNNSCRIIIDGEQYAAPEVTFNYDFSQRHIMIINNWQNGNIINIKNGIQVVFAEDENGTLQAEGFKGLAISGK